MAVTPRAIHPRMGIDAIRDLMAAPIILNDPASPIFAPVEATAAPVFATSAAVLAPVAAVAPEVAEALSL